MRSLISRFIVWALRCSFTEFSAYSTEQHLTCICLLQICATDKKNPNKYKSLTLWGEWLDWTTVWQGRLQVSALPLRARLCIPAPPHTSLGGNSFLILFFHSFSFHPKSQFPFEWPAAQWHSWSMCSVMRHLWANTRPFQSSKVHVFSSGNS